MNQTPPRRHWVLCYECIYCQCLLIHYNQEHFCPRYWSYNPPNPPTRLQIKKVDNSTQTTVPWHTLKQTPSKYAEYHAIPAGAEKEFGINLMNDEYH